MTDDEVSDLIDRISGAAFDEWYQEREWARNIRNGTPYFNGPSSVPAATRHTPSRLLQCHRKVAYRQTNAPAEEAAPDGIFWAGRRFEHDLVVPYLREAVVGDNLYVVNSLWIDITIDTPAGELRFKGVTDPCIVDREGTPVLHTEVELTRSVTGMTTPNRHHRAQVHAYMRGLTEKHDRAIDDAVIIYGSRQTMDVTTFRESFDPEFWQDVVRWARTHTEYREAGDLPPADPEYGWECDYYSYAHRCGETDREYGDVGISGLLPLFAEYPRDELREYLQAHEDARLTPTLAREYPELAATYGAYEWSCPGCGGAFAWDAVDWNGDPDHPPVCPECAADGTLLTLTEPQPSEQTGGHHHAS